MDHPPDTRLLHQVFYISRSLTDALQVERILASARQQNQQRRVTGALLFTGGHFAQLIEGPPRALAETMAVIAADRRHEAVTRLLEGALPRRRFGDWTMAFIEAPGADDLIAQLLQTPQIAPARAERLLRLMFERGEALAR